MFDQNSEAEWRPVPEVVRLTLRAMHDVVKQQGEALERITKQLANTHNKQQLQNILNEKLNKEDVHKTFDKLSHIIDAKPDLDDLEKTLRAKTEPKIAAKADTNEVQRCLDEKANVDEVQQLFDELEARRSAAEPRIVAAADAAAREAAADAAAKLEARLREHVDARVSELRRDLTDVVSELPTRAGLAAELKKRASRSDVEELLLEQAENLASALAAKADSAAMSAALAAKAPAAGLVDARSELDRLRVDVTRAETSRSQTAHEVAELERRLADLQAETGRSVDALRAAASRSERELREYDHAVRGALVRAAAASGGGAAAAATPASSSGRSPASRAVDGTLGLLHASELFEAADSLRRAIAADAQHEAQRQLGELRAELSAKLETAITERANELRVDVTALEQATAASAASLGQACRANEAALRLKCDTAEVEAALTRKAETTDMRGWLEWRAAVDEEIARRTSATHEALATKADKSDARALAELEMALERRIDALSGTLQEAIGARLETNQLAELVRPLIEQRLRDVTGVSELVQRKADIDEVNRSLTEVNRELSLRPTLSELNRVVGEQSLILESLCSEHLLGRWIWKSGRVRGERHVVPWNVQNINTNPENFGWERDRTSILCTAPGLYEVTFGFYARRKPTVQLLVNGEPVLSAVNSATYAVHHSSGRLAAVGPHPAGNVTGLTLIDYIALPPKARVAVSYQGEEGEGFMGLRKM